MDNRKKLVRTGYIAFMLSGLCAISSGVIVSILQDKYGFNYSTSGTLLSLMSIGNMMAAFATGILPGKIGQLKTVAYLCSGYFIGYILMAMFGNVGILMGAFMLVGIAKGCAINTCTILVGNNCEDRAIGMSLMHACYATGAMVCPFIISALVIVNQNLPMIGIAIFGLVMWIVFMLAGLEKGTMKKDGEKVTNFSFLKSVFFWLLTALIFCQNAGETAVTGWLVTYYKDNGILSGALSTYTVTIMWGATLIARLLIVFVLRIKNTFKATAIMGIGCVIMYFFLLKASTPITAIVFLFLFAFSMAGVNPVGMAGIGKAMNSTSVGVLIPVASLGSIIMPYIIGIVADKASLNFGMALNIIPCVGIFIISIVLLSISKRQG